MITTATGTEIRPLPFLVMLRLIGYHRVLHFYDECGDTMLFEQDLFVKPYEPMVYERDTVRVCPGDFDARSVPRGEQPVVFTWLTT